ncbi:(d)CMP kinase [Sulfobacillus harzensis]|uniref:Cytidylate kinase n=1 Tax=Sulfobacillus harzensis TaxID=2729629 RepID=A0A7Y0L359_9FIRM|nr:(d)CMP kinase [Sulfobacillus harzensis]
MTKETGAGVIAVDGPAGAGKSTVARRLAAELGFLYLDTGAMYRALALKALHEGVDLRDEAALASLLSDTTIDLYPAPEGRVRVIVDGADVTDHLRSPEVNASVALVAGFASVRSEMVSRQRDMARQGAVVMDGRDIGTFVLPDAEVKFFLTASLEARSERRCQELTRLGYDVSLERIREEIQHRDLLDSSRPYAPLAMAEDAVLIDTTHMEVNEVVARMLAICRHRLG